MKGPDFRAALWDADRVLAGVGLPPAADARLRRRLAARPATRGRPWFALAVAGAAAAGVVLAWQARTPAPRGEALAVSEGSADLVLARGEVDGLPSVEVTRGRCVLVDEPTGASVAVLAPSRVVRDREGVRLLRGRVEVRVRPRAPGQAPARVLVSGGAIEVMGTRFTVVQRADDGEVILHEGRIRFVHPGGTVELAPGETLAWPPRPRPPEPAAAPAPAATATGEPPAPAEAPDPARPRPRRPSAAPEPPEPPEPIEQLLERVAVMRSRAQYEAAARALAGALQGDYPAAARERLSYELGSILTHQIADPARACAHWRAHARRFGSGRYEREVDQASSALGCPRR